MSSTKVPLLCMAMHTVRSREQLNESADAEVANGTSRNGTAKAAKRGVTTRRMPFFRRVPLSRYLIVSLTQFSLGWDRPTPSATAEGIVIQVRETDNGQR